MCQVGIPVLEYRHKGELKCRHRVFLRQADIRRNPPSDWNRLYPWAIFARTCPLASFIRVMVVALHLRPGNRRTLNNLHSHPSAISHTTFPSLRPSIMSNWSPHTLSRIGTGFFDPLFPLVNLITSSNGAACNETLASYEAMTRRMTVFLQHYGVYQTAEGDIPVFVISR